MKILKNDAKSSVEGIIYQFYIALEYAFKLPKESQLYIELYGDVTISDNVQIEVKSYKDKLSNYHKNFWKSLYNWMDDSFKDELYNKLVLLTTQEVGSRSKFKTWNDISKKEKLEILQNLQGEYTKKKKRDKELEKYISFILDKVRRKKLIGVLDKFFIVTSNPSSEKLYNDLCNIKGNFLDEDKRELYIDYLMGYVLSPSKENNQWVITHQGFADACRKCAKMLLNSDDCFPRTFHNPHVPLELYKGHLFIRKIEDIKYHEVLQEAVGYYAEVNSLVIHELLNHQTSKEQYEIYEDEVLTQYKIMYRKYSRKMNSNNCINESKDFYDDMMIMKPQPFMTYTDTPSLFKNGILHMNADDDNQDIVWKLGENNGKGNK